MGAWGELFHAKLYTPPMIDTKPPTFDLTTIVYCVDSRNTQKFESESSMQIIFVCFMLLLLTSVLSSSRTCTVTPFGILRIQELCESRGDRPGLPSLKVLTVFVDVKQS